MGTIYGHTSYGRCHDNHCGVMHGQEHKAWCSTRLEHDHTPKLTKDQMIREQVAAYRDHDHAPKPADKPALAHQEGGGHYKEMAIQPFEYIHKNGIGFAEGCVIKYVTHWKAKGGVEDLRKARHFLDLLIEEESA